MSSRIAAHLIAVAMAAAASVPGAFSVAVAQTPAAAPVAEAPMTAIPAPQLPLRSGPLGAVKTWGYQLTNLDPQALAASPYDLLVIDYSRDGSDDKALTPAEVAAMKVKPDGSRRIVLSYLSIGEAESYRYYWKWYWRSLWFLPNPLAPSWRGNLNADWGGNYAVRYWEPAWQQVILGDGGYLDRIVKAGFDGVWLDKVDSSLEAVARNNKSAKPQMVALVSNLAARARAAKPGFLVVPQNGEELLTDPGYRAVIDGIGKESLMTGEDGPGKLNPPQLIEARSTYLNLAATEGKTVLAVEYLDAAPDIASARVRLEKAGFVPHFADRDLGALRIGDLPPDGVTSSGGRPKKQ